MSDLILNNISEGVVIIDINSIILAFNNRFNDEIKKYTFRDVCKGNRLDEELACIPKVNPAFKDYLNKAIKNKTNYTFYDEIQLSSRRLYEIKFLIDNSNKNAIKVISIIKAITSSIFKEENENSGIPDPNDLPDESPLAFSILKNGEIVYANNEYLRLLGYEKKSEVLGENVISHIPFFDHTKNEEGYNSNNGNIINTTLQGEIKKKDGSNFAALISFKDLQLDNGRATIAYIRDISNTIGLPSTVSKKAERQIKKLSRLYTFLSETNKILIKTENENDLYDKICEIAVTKGNISLAVIGIINNESKDIIPIKAYGYNAANIMKISTSTLDNDRGAGVTGKCVRLREPVVSNDLVNDPNLPFKSDAIRLGLKSCISLPVQLNNEVIGVFALYSKELNFFDESEINLLEVIASEISFALAFHKKKENEKIALKALAAGEKRFKQLFQNAPLPYQLLDLDGNILAVNAKWLKAFGYKVSEVAGKPFKNIITKKYHPVFEKNFQDLITQGEIFNVEFEFLTKNNKVFIGSLDAGIDYNGKAVPTQAYCMINDITEKKRQQDKILKLNRLYSFLSETNKVLVRVSSKEELFNKITDIAYDIGKFKLAWAGLINWQNNEVIPVSMRGNDKEIFNKIKIKIDDSPNASGISGRAVRNNRPVWSNNILSDPEMIFFYETALNNAYNSCIAFPLYIDANIIGVFSLYAAEVNFFDSEEISLLKEIASNISYALSVFKNNEDKAEYEELLKYQAQLLLNVSDAIISTDNDLNIKSWNKAAEHLYGFTSSEVVGRKAGEILNLKLREVTFSQIAQIIRAEGSWKRELSSVNKKGKNLEISISFSNMVDGNNNATGFVAIMRDVSERKTAESKLRTLSTAVEQSSLAVIITDVSGRIEYVNKRFLQITGYSLSEAIGQKPSILKSGLNKEEIYKELWETITGGKDWKGEFLNKKKNGEYFWETASISPIKDGEGRIVNFVGIKEDITEKKHIIQELIQAKEKAEESNKVKTYFLSNMSHELRTPMMGILGFADILKNEITNPNLKEMVKNISYSGNRLLETLNLILNLSRIEANKIEIDYSAINLAEFVEGHTKLFEGAAFIKRIYLNTSIHYPDISILADKRILRDILNNLLTNAIKYTEKGGVVVEIDMVIVDGTKKLAVIKVKDTGIGIPEDKTKLIFEEFRQVSEGLNRRFEGTGLGLTITKKLVNLLNGEISVESKIGKGSVFSISFPVNEQAVAAVKTDDDVELDKVMPFKAAARGKKSILLVEDDSSSQLIASILLKTLGKVDVVATGEEAIAKVTTKNYSIILMDINLGIGINGIDAVRKIRKYDNYKYTPIVAITAFAMEGDREEFLSKGFTHYISKPYKNEALFNMIKEILQ